MYRKHTPVEKCIALCIAVLHLLVAAGPLDALRSLSFRFTLGPQPAFAQSSADIAVHFSPGLNLFSLPVAVSPATDSCFELLSVLGGSSAAQSISRFNTATQIFEVCAYSGSTAAGENFSIRDGEGYQVRMKADKTVLFNGAAVCPALNLKKGTNLIGVPSPSAGLSCFDLLEALGAEKISTSQGYDKDLGAFEACAFANGSTPAGDDFPIVAGEAYLVSMRQDVAGFNVNDQSRCQQACLPPTITNISPRSGKVGTEVTITGTNLDCGTTRTLKCGEATLSITSLSPTQIKTLIPPGAQDCRVSLTTDGGAVTVPDSLSFDVVLSRDFSLAIHPDESSVLPGSSTLYRVSADGPDDFTDLITLNVSGLPAGVTGSFFPSVVTAGQSSTLTIEAANNAAQATKTFTVTGTAKIDGMNAQHSASAVVKVLAGGQTALVGQVKFTNGPPLAGVKLIFANLQGQPTQTTDSSGNFQFVGLPVGEHTLTVDATVGTPVEPFSFNGPLPMYGVNVTLTAGQTLELPPLQICPQPKPEQFTPLQNQTQNQVITDARFPGATFMVPAGTTITGWDGIPKTKMGMEKLTPDQLPVPPPPGPTRSLYQPFFGTPMGGVPSDPIPVTFPNDLDLKPGEKADLWYYDAAPFPGVPGDWRLAGSGTVSEDGSKIVSDEKLGDGIGDDDGICETGEKCVGIERFCGVCGLSCFIPRQQGQPNNNPDGPDGGDPVNLALGQMIVEKTDMVLPGRIPAVVHRTYNPFDPFGAIAGFQLSFGPGWGLSVEVVLQAETASLRRIILPGNSRFAFTRQGDGKFVNTTHPRFAGAVLTDEGGNVHTLRFKDGTRWRFVPSARVGGFGLLGEQIDGNGNRLVIEHNNSDKITRIIEPAGRELTFNVSSGRVTEVTDPIGRVVRYSYNGAGRLETVTDPEGGATKYTYDSQGKILTITDPRNITYLTNHYNADGRVDRQTMADGGVWTFNYLFPECAPGVACSTAGTPTGVIVTDPRGNATTTHFSATGFEREIVNALGQATRFDRDAAGQVTAVTDPIGRVTRFEYDALGNVTKITDPAGNASRFEYESTFNRLTKLTDPLGNVTRFTYDAQGNLIKVTDPLGHISQIAYSNFGQPTSVTDALGHSSTLAYDAQGNLTSLSDPLGNSTTRAYDLVSRLTAQTDPRGRTTRFAYDDLNRIEQIVDALNGITAFSHDGNGNVLTVTDALSHTTTYAYDSMDRVSRRTDPLGKAEISEYDRQGNLTRYTDRKGQVSTFAYDVLDRLTTANHADSSSSFVYDTVGRLIQATDSLGGAIVNEYDELDRLIAQATGQGTVEYAYDALDRRVSMNVTGQSPVAYAYDAKSRLTQITQGSQIVDFTYDAMGRRTQLTLPNGVSTEYKYDLASRLTEQIYRNATGVLGNLTYGYDPNGNRKEVGGSFARTLLPDPVAAVTYDAANRQRTFGNKAMDFDANGNLISIASPSGSTTLTWDARDRLAALSGPGVAALFTYDISGRRTAKQINGQLTQFLYDGVDIVQENADGALVNFLRSLGIDELLGQNNREYSLADILGSTVALTSSAGLLQTEYSYEPFGKTSATGATSENPFQYTGRENDGTGLYYYRARYYDPQVNRFISEDPVGFSGGDVNLYAYVKDNPINRVDPTGLCGADAILDVGFLLYDLYRLAADGRKGLGDNLTSLGLDAAGLVIPCATGLGAARRAGKAAEKAIDAQKSIKSRGYDRPWTETKSGKAVKQQDAIDDWNDFLGPNQTNIDPRDGLPDPDRIWSADGKRSVRFGEHEMNSNPNKLHYHKETWHPGRVENELQRVQK